MADSSCQTMIKVVDHDVEDTYLDCRAILLPLWGGSLDSYPLKKEKTVLGRAADADIQLEDEQASRYHASIFSMHNFYYIQDMNSTNGTFFNGTRVTSMRLAHGDVIKMGNTEFRYVISEEGMFGSKPEIDLETVKTLALAVEAKDPYTRGHSERVAEVAVQLARSMNLVGEDLELLRIGALLHDVGKIGVPEAVLLKKGKLSNDEFDIIKKHPAAGEKIIKPIGFLADILPVVLHHHERFDGCGYPKGLGGEDFPLFARIVQVADTFDAMTSNRPYRDPMPIEEVIKEFHRCSGSQFDPRITEVFLRIIHTL